MLQRFECDVGERGRGCETSHSLIMEKRIIGVNLIQLSLSEKSERNFRLNECSVGKISALRTFACRYFAEIIAKIRTCRLQIYFRQVGIAEMSC